MSDVKKRLHDITQELTTLSDIDILYAEKMSNTSDAKITKANLTAQLKAEIQIGLLDDRGNYDASGNTFPASGGSGTAGAILKGDIWLISVAGTLGGVAVVAGDTVRALTDTPGQTASNWAIVEGKLTFTPEDAANKDTTTTLGTSDVKYPSQKAVKTYVDTAIQGLQTNYIENLLIENTTSAITVMAGFRVFANGVLYSYGSDQTPSLTAIDALIGAGGYGWCALCVSEADGTISAQLLGAGVPSFPAANTLGFANGTTKDTENQLALGAKYNNVYGYVRSQINGTGTFYRIIAVFKRVITGNDATVDSTSASYAFVCDSTAKLTVGMSVSQSGSADIPANAEIVEITDATHFRINVVATGSHSNITMVIATDIVSIVAIEKRPKTFVKMYQNIISSATKTNAPINFVSIDIDLNSEISGNSAARLYTASRAKKIHYNFTGKTYSGNGANIYFLYLTSKLYKIMDYAHGANRIIETFPPETFNLRKNDTLQLNETQSDSAGNNPGNYPRNMGLVIEEI
jgi:hypothetical protein